MAPPRATIQNERVRVPDEKDANALYNKGTFGVPQSGGALLLDLVEALYLVEHNRLRVDEHDAASLLRFASVTEREFEVRYIVYRDLRNRTFTVKPSNLTDFNVFARGALPGKAPSTHLVRCVSERGALDGAALLDEVARARKHQKQLLVALVDEEGDLTYFEATEPALSANARALPGFTADAHFLEDSVIVSDKDQRRALFDEGYFGRDIGLVHQLSLPEAVYLAQADALRVREAAGGQAIPPDELLERANRLEPEFPLRLALYAAMRKRGLVVKTGFKFGTHFRIYTGAPDEEHAPYLVHALPRERRVAWPEVAGFVRLAHGVRKRLFFAVPFSGRALSEGREASRKQAGPPAEDAAASENDFRLLELARRKP